MAKQSSIPPVLSYPTGNWTLNAWSLSCVRTISLRVPAAAECASHYKYTRHQSYLFDSVMWLRITLCVADSIASVFQPMTITSSGASFFVVRHSQRSCSTDWWYLCSCLFFSPWSYFWLTVADSSANKVRCGWSKSPIHRYSMNVIPMRLRLTNGACI